MAEKKKEQFGSSIGFVFTMIGMAFGLGAIWRFPYVTAQSGGGAFVLMFLIITLVLAVPAGMAEIAFARKMHSGPVVAFKKVLGNKLGRIAWIYPIIPTGLNMFYMVVTAWTLAYICFSVFYGNEIMADPVGFFNNFSDNRMAVFAWTVVTILLNALILWKGIQGGVEKFCKYGIPLLFVILGLLMIRVLTLPNIAAGIQLFVEPDWSQMLNFSMWARATGMALFAIGLGPAALMAYGAYLPEDSDIPTDFLTVAFWNLLGCILSGLIIVPAVVAFGLDLNSGPNLTFITLPFVFAQLPFSIVIALGFFAAMALGAFSSSVGIMENSVTTVSGGLGWSRKKTIIFITIITILGAIPCIWSEKFLAAMDFFIGDVGYTLTASVMAILLAWYVGAKKVREEWIKPGSTFAIPALYDPLYKYIICPVLVLLFVQFCMNIPKILSSIFM